MQELTSRPSKLDLAIVLFCVIFILVLFISAYYEREVLPLHIFQSLIYVTIIFLSLKHNKWGYGIAVSISLLWNVYNSFSGFVFDAGFKQWSGFLSTGKITNPVHFVAPPAWFDHIALIFCSFWAYIRLSNKKLGDIGVFFASLIGVAVYFLGIIAIFWSEFIPRMLQLLHLK